MNCETAFKRVCPDSSGEDKQGFTEFGCFKKVSSLGCCYISPVSAGL